MKIAVCVKQIPDPSTPYWLDPVTHYVVRPEDQVLDDTDRYGVEVGLQLADAGDGTVALFSMSPSGSLQGIRQALAMGADKAVLIDDESLRGSAALTTAKVLAAAIKREGFDIVITGTESTDGYTGVIPQQLSELLDTPALTFARKVEADNGVVTIERQTARGYDVVTAPLPAVVSVTAGSVEPRYPTFKGIMAAKQKEIEQLTAADLGLGADDVGASGAQQTITEVVPVEARQAGEIIEDDGEGYRAIIALLESVKVI
jgi:electron transfer flavoprotein beta subunit